MKHHIRTGIGIAALLTAFMTFGGYTGFAQKGAKAVNVHSFSVATIDGKEADLKGYEGNVLLIVNTASKCGYTPQYEPLEKLYKTYKEKGLRILAFPANNFGQQEPGTNEEIKEFCSTAYNVTFDLFAKISVKGDDIAPLYKYLTQDSPFKGDIKWNFNKFLVDKHGVVVARWDSRADPMSDEITTAVGTQLAKK